VGFHEDIALETVSGPRPHATDEVTTTRFAGNGPASWGVIIGLNGGFGAAVVLSAMTAAAEAARDEAATGGAPPRQPARSVTVQYLRAFAPGPFLIDADVVRRGRSTTFTAARLVQDDRVVLAATAVFAAPGRGLEFDDGQRPAIVPPATLVGRVDAEPDPPPFVHNYDMRLASPVLQGGPVAEVHGWMRLASPTEPLDACVLAAMADALPPASFGRATAPLGLPTIELHVLFRRPLPHPAVPAGAWIQGEVATRLATDGFSEEDCRLWGPDGTLLAQSRQLASTRTTPNS
jgi:acyl-CoA thioesterase